MAVSLTTGFYMATTEVTQAQWADVMGDDYVPPEGVHPNELSGRRFQGPTMPAYASWFEAAEYCRRLSQREGMLYRLPTEAEWEYACRAGTDSAYHEGVVLDPSQANTDGDRTVVGLPPAADRPLPVASFPANAWGLFDMHGNVWEWCADWKAAYPLGPLTDPTGPETGAMRVLRGGAWDAPVVAARCANRWANFPELRTDAIGFRVMCLRDVAPPVQPPPLLPERTAFNLSARPAGPFAELPVSAIEALDPALPEYQPQVVVAGRLRSTGSDSMDQLMRLWERAFQRWHPQLVIRHEGRGSGTAPPALLEGLADVGPMSRPLSADERREFLQERGYAPQQVVVALDALAVYAHPDNPIVARGLSLAELDAVFSTTRRRGHPASIRNWGVFGFEDDWLAAPIHVYGRNSASGTHQMLRKLALDGGDFRPDIIELVGSAAVVAAVAVDRFGIGYSGIGYARDENAVVPLARDGGSPIQPTSASAHRGAYPLTRPLYLTVAASRDAPLTDVQREFLEFVFSRAGQRVRRPRGLFPARRRRGR